MKNKSDSSGILSSYVQTVAMKAPIMTNAPLFRSDQAYTFDPAQNIVLNPSSHAIIMETSPSGLDPEDFASLYSIFGSAGFDLEKVHFWKCERCFSMNSHVFGKCKNCDYERQPFAIWGE